MSLLPQAGEGGPKGRMRAAASRRNPLLEHRHGEDCRRRGRRHGAGGRSLETSTARQSVYKALETFSSAFFMALAFNKHSEYSKAGSEAAVMADPTEKER